MIIFRRGLLLTLQAACIVIGAASPPPASPPDDSPEPSRGEGYPPRPPQPSESDGVLVIPAPDDREAKQAGAAGADRHRRWARYAEQDDGKQGETRAKRALGSKMWWRRWPPWGKAREEKTYGKEQVLSEITEDTPATAFTLLLQEGEAGDTEGFAEGGGLADGIQWKGAGGEFGLSADWREALSVPDGDVGGDRGRGVDGKSLRGGACMTEEKRAEVGRILEKRKKNPATNKVAICVRTKDFARFLPEWIAFHYVLGVDEIGVYDDDSTDNTREVLQPFVDAGIVNYVFKKIKGRGTQMLPLNHCLHDHFKRRNERGGGGGDNGTSTSDGVARWVLFHDTDEYLFPMDTNLTIPDALGKHGQSCCTMVPRVQYGSGRHDQMPRGLILEAFQTHNRPGKGPRSNGNAKVTLAEAIGTEVQVGWNLARGSITRGHIWVLV